jgi:hypothetical protein
MYLILLKIFWVKGCIFRVQSASKFIRLSSSLLIICLFGYSNIAHADVSGIPDNPDFKNAEYPYAQAPDGCSGINSPKEVRDSWGPVNFTGACNTHDKCYYTVGSKWNTCNERFYSDLRTACERDLRIAVRNPFTGKKHYLAPDPVRLVPCYGIATAYYTSVQAGVAFNVFKDAQEKQKNYERWVSGLRASATPPPQPLPSASPTKTGGCQFVVGTDYANSHLGHQGFLTISNSSTANGNGTSVSIFTGSWRIKSASEGQPVTVQTAGSRFLMIRDMGDIKQAWVGNCASDGFARGTVWDPTLPTVTPSFVMKSQ